MRAVIIPRSGYAEVLTVTEVPTPEAGPGEVAIDVAFAGAAGTRHSTTNTPSSVRWRAAFSKHRTWSSWVSRLPMMLNTRYTSPYLRPGGDSGHVAHGHLDLVAARLPAHPVDHVPGQLDAVDAHAGCHQRQGDASGTHGELQRVAVR